MKYSKYIIASLLLVVLSLPAMAQLGEDDIEERKANLPEFVDDSKRLEFSFYYVLQSVKTNIHHIPGGEDTVSTADLSRNQFELSMAYYFGRYKSFGIELLAGTTLAGGVTRDFGTFDDPDNPVVFPINELEHSVFNFGGNLIYNFGKIDLVPFVYIGGGVEVFDVPEESTFPLTETYPYFNLGIGFKYLYTEWFGGSIRIEDRLHFYDSEVSQGNLNQYRLSLGVVVSF